MGKVKFSARKDPLLRPRSAAGKPSQDGRDALTQHHGDSESSADASSEPKNRSSVTARARPMSARATEGPAGVVAVDAGPDKPARGNRNGERRPEDSSDTSAPAAPREPAERSRHITRRVQTSVSLPPDVWDTLDELGRGAGVSAGELLTTILTGAIPDSPTSAIAALEQLLISIPPDEGLHEERNYRLPLELRTKLDELATALGPGPRSQRSLLIRAIVASHTPTSSEQARELITTRRIDAMRATMLAAATD